MKPLGPNSSQMSTFNFQHNEFTAFFGNDGNYDTAFPKNARKVDI